MLGLDKFNVCGGGGWGGLGGGRVLRNFQCREIFVYFSNGTIFYVNIYLFK